MNQKKEIIDYVEAVSRIPSIWPIFYHHISALFEEYKKDIENFGAIGKGTPINPYLPYPHKETNVTVEYIMKRVKNRWRHDVTPHEGSETVHLPEQIFQFIAGLPDNNAITMRKNCELQGVPGRIFNITAVWETPNRISGTIEEKNSPAQKINNHLQGEGEADILQEQRQKMASLFQYMERYPIVLNHIMDEFEMVLLPLVEKTS